MNVDCLVEEGGKWFLLVQAAEKGQRNFVAQGKTPPR